MKDRPPAQCRQFTGHAQERSECSPGITTSVLAAMEPFSKSAHHKFSGLLFPGTVGSTLTEFSSGCVFPIPPQNESGTENAGQWLCPIPSRSEERRVGKECRTRWLANH